MQGREQETGGDVPWPVRYPAKVPPGEEGKGRNATTQSRWSGIGSAGSREIRRRLIWLLLAVEIGMALVAACLLPLVFVGFSPGEGGIVTALLERAGDPGTSLPWILCLGLLLPVPILFLTLALIIGIYRLPLKSRKG